MEKNWEVKDKMAERKYQERIEPCPCLDTCQARREKEEIFGEGFCSGRVGDYEHDCEIWGTLENAYMVVMLRKIRQDIPSQLTPFFKKLEKDHERKLQRNFDKLNPHITN